jgi:hypothetical protein
VTCDVRRSADEPTYVTATNTWGGWIRYASPWRQTGERDWCRIIYRMFHLKLNWLHHINVFMVQNDDTNGNTEFFQQYPLLSADALLQLFCRSMSTCHRQTLPVSRNFVTSRCTLSYSALLYQGTHCYMLHEQHHTISMRSDVREWTRVLLMNTLCSHLYRFCTTSEQRPTILSGSLVTTAWRVLRLRMDETASRYGG